MYLKTDSMGRHEIVGDLESTIDESVNSADPEVAQLAKLRRKFFDSYNESLQYKKPFRNPLTNTDMAWLYNQAAQFLYQHPVMDRFSDPGDLVYNSTTLLKEIDQSLEKLRKARIPIVGEKR